MHGAVAAAYSPLGDVHRLSADHAEVAPAEPLSALSRVARSGSPTRATTRTSVACAASSARTLGELGALCRPLLEQLGGERRKDLAPEEPCHLSSAADVALGHGRRSMAHVVLDVGDPIPSDGPPGDAGGA